MILDAWIRRFKVIFVPPEELGDLAAVHKLTTLGRAAHLDDFEILIASDLAPWADILVFHEALENKLRRERWNYRDSNEAALIAEALRFGNTTHYDEYLRAMGEEAASQSSSPYDGV